MRKPRRDITSSRVRRRIYLFGTRIASADSHGPSSAPLDCAPSAKLAILLGAGIAMGKRRGYFAIGIYGAKNSINMGTLWRTAQLMGAQYIFTIGQRYKRQPSDVYDTSRHMPLFEFATFEEFQAVRPKDCLLVGVELTDDALLLDRFSHPERAIYLLGAEDLGLPDKVLAKCQAVVRLRGERSMNVATTGSIVLYHRTMECA